MLDRLARIYDCLDKQTRLTIGAVVFACAVAAGWFAVGVIIQAIIDIVHFFAA